MKEALMYLSVLSSSDWDSKTRLKSSKKKKMYVGINVISGIQ